MLYEVVRSHGMADEWRVEAIDDGNEGVVYVSIFSGPEAEARAQEYAGWKNGQAQHARRPVARQPVGQSRQPVSF